MSWEGLKLKDVKKAEEYPKLYEIQYMNADTPRLSGSEYLIHGFKAGCIYKDALERALVERLKELGQAMPPNAVSMEIQKALKKFEGES